MNNMTTKLIRAWFSNAKWVWCLFPLTFVFWLLSCIRRFLFRTGLFASNEASIPVIVVGNIGVGGNGKTPLVLALVTTLQNKGYTLAVLSRGYGGSQTNFPCLVDKNDSAALVGDEPALISKRACCIVVIDPVRARGVKFIEQNTAANVIICDDGLQHYAMQRDVEICVLDKRGVGNGYLLPMGPLREGVWRLKTVDALVHNIGFSAHKESSKANLDSVMAGFEMRLQPSCWVNVNTQETKSLAEFAVNVKRAGENTVFTALAGIGDPKRFFDTLENMQLKLDRTISFSDHHQFTQDDLPTNGWVLMTEKDAVKCIGFIHKNAWYLRIDATIDDDFYTLIEDRVQAKSQLLVKKRAITPRQ
jgi:tetraacyldisaccharide 4'-kinase